ncbi:hypothetical protein [Halostella salina]|uniref:hypothetical protein n=1 Tax=Halostella salina TaxID=1547897 RepID=UPI000EF79CFB|nr:hypothetical protein [Halostella salina]
MKKALGIIALLLLSTVAGCMTAGDTPTEAEPANEAFSVRIVDGVAEEKVVNYSDSEFTADGAIRGIVDRMLRQNATENGSSIFVVPEDETAAMSEFSDRKPDGSPHLYVRKDGYVIEITAVRADRGGNATVPYRE